jgi:hypothetical protein
VDTDRALTILHVGVFPALGRLCVGVGSLELDELVHEVAAHGHGAEHVAELGVLGEPVCVERRPVVVGSVGDAIDDVMDLTRFMQQLAHALRSPIHTFAPRLGKRRPERYALPGSSVGPGHVKEAGFDAVMPGALAHGLAQSRDGVGGWTL